MTALDNTDHHTAFAGTAVAGLTFTCAFCSYAAMLVMAVICVGVSQGVV